MLSLSIWEPNKKPRMLRGFLFDKAITWLVGNRRLMNI